ncbi:MULTISPECIES: YCF48-related protein [unclassified Pseudomonas]|uniref:WD40/YVTN/BNR-like repeat-containing protein n=1 Tax=unclassified Pseudomonas TaxID=196821 RepID=UPI00147519DA|nr:MULTISPECIES: YCF48-related protein [unclassified Pseudomonas]NMY39039.1 glycosyl hydrolase [Pseudomonas sp. WS 5078]NMY61883.1 glycosyl hydrolase [Pseudomonas sp. WS 5354]NMY74809.1 glycosyl hydrolase [Pseudomonas sp. WS 5071]
MRSIIGYLVCLIVAATIGFTFAPRKTLDVAAEPLRPDRLQINGMLYLDQRVVAVGERGTILLSDDQGVSWQPATVQPQRDLTLTAVVALADDSLLAVGHDGWILRSADRGAQWQEVRHDSELGEPLLGIWSAGGKHVLAFGSFGKFYQSDDDGRTWQTAALSVDSAHLNGMDGGPDGRRMLVGEQGLVMRTDDAGQHWETLPPFYNGSLFGVVRLNPQRWVAYGMRGHVFVTQDFGHSWHQVAVGNSLPLYGHALLPNGEGVLIVGAGSSMVRLDGQGQLVSATRLSGLGTLTSAVLVGANRLLVGGERGVFQGTDSSVAARAQ